MIPRQSAAQRGPVLVTPRDRSGDLPAWNPAPPATPKDAFDAALAYAREYEGAHGTERGLAGAAYRAILAAFPGVKRAELVERLHGLDRFADHFDDPAPF